MIITDIKANTPEWKEARKKYVGASEIYNLVWHYFPKELEEQAKILNCKIDKPFKSAYETWHKIKYGQELEMKKIEDGTFGHEVEKFLKYHESSYNERAQNLFVINPDYHTLAACSPDYFCDKQLYEYKTSRYIETHPLKLKYVFQLQYQMRGCEIDDARLSVAFSNYPGLDSDFERGKIVGALNVLLQNQDFEIFNNKFNEYFYVDSNWFNAIPEIQGLCLQALNALQFDLEVDNPPISSDSDFAYNDLKLKAMIEREKFGPLDVRYTGLDQALEEYKYGKEQAASIYNELETGVEYQIRLALLENVELVGSNFRAYYDKGHKLRIVKDK